MVKKELTASERFVVLNILEEARRCMKYDSAQQEYIDDGSFIMCHDKDDMAALTRAIKKL